MTTNKDCDACAFSNWYQDGGGDYDDMQCNCAKTGSRITYTRADHKPCKLPEGQHYEAVYNVTKTKI